MSMFENYNNDLTDYVPNNLPYKCQKIYPYPIPYTEYNAEGDIVGYYWYYGDTVNLVFEIDGETTVEDKLEYVDVSDTLEGMKAKIDIYNFRYENIYSYTTDASTEITLSIGKDLSNTMIKGIYYITLTVFDETTQTYIPLFKDKDCTVTVK